MCRAQLLYKLCLLSSSFSAYAVYVVSSFLLQNQQKIQNHADFIILAPATSPIMLTIAPINVEDIVPDKVYKVVTNSFLTDGGDNYIPFTRGTDVAKLDSQREVIKNYIASASQEAPIALKTEGRIIVEE